VERLSLGPKDTRGDDVKVLTAEEMAVMDRRATEEFGIPSLTLMEHAGESVAEVAARVVGDLRGRRISIFCGKGNNGGDGLVAARCLLRMGARPKVFLLGSPQEIKPDPRTNLDAIHEAGVEFQPVTAREQLDGVRREAEASALLIDAIFGTGFAPPVRGFAGEVISLIENLPVPVLAVDVPSGLSADHGAVSGQTVTADSTVTFGLPKVGQFLYPAAARYGRLYLADIGFPSSLAEGIAASHHLITGADCARSLTPRAGDSHKGDHGHVLLMAGSRGFAGASMLAARGALRSGAGLVTVALPASQAPPFLDTLPEAMLLPLPETSRGSVGEDALDVILEHLAGKKVLAFGPGLSREPATALLVRRLISRAGIPMVIDADGLNALAGDTSLLDEVTADIVITPHPGEFGRLIGLTPAEVQGKRIEVAREFSREHGVTVVLKGAMTVVASPSGEVYINPTGNAGMAAGGMGDVLTGILASFVAQGFDLLTSTLLGVYVHGKAGDTAAARIGPWGYLAGEVADGVPSVIGNLLTPEPDEEDNHGKIRLLLP
jgi:NAD(P)H-hydrate epimerase